MKVSFRQIQLLSVLYLIAWMLAPPLAYDTIFRVFAIFASLIWIFLQINIKAHTIKKRDKKIDRYLQYYLFCVVIYSITLFLFRCIYDNMSFFQAFYNDITTYILLFNGYIAGTYCRDRRYEDLKCFFYFSLIIGVIFSITAIFRSSEFYELTRNAGGNITEENLAIAVNAAKHGVGSFGFFCFTSVFSPMVLLYALEKKENKLLFIVSFIVMEIGVFSAGYTLALLISVVGIFLVVFFRMKNLYSRLIVIFIAILLFLFWNDILNILYLILKRLSIGTMYENKVNDIFGFLLEGDSVGSFAARQERYVYSLTSIFKYPIFGSYIINDTRAVGYHSSILDTFAAYGWLIGFAYLYIIVIYPCKMANKKRKKLNIIIFVLLFLTALFNTYTMNMGIFYYLVPYMFNSIGEETMYIKSYK